MKTAEEAIKAAVAYPPNDAAIDDLSDIVGAALAGGLKTAIGTGALIDRLVPGCKPGHPTYRLAVSALQRVRARPHCALYWEYTGRKNHFGKPALHWLPQ